ncbi:MAG: diguanylate cyclase [Cyanothece sp. SIO1E1]|nr:diguanylate cyclase [Cyanothece sp. SIO1E1]
MPRYALVIGIAAYDHFRNLPKAATDAGAIARIFSQHGNYQIEPLPKRLIEADDHWEIAPDKKLTSKTLGQTLRTFLLDRTPYQEALIYFAGHGFEALSFTGESEGYLATSDSYNDGRNAIRFDDLNKLISKSNLSSLVVILDCCHAGSFLERSLLESTLTTFKEKQDYYLITACRSFEQAREGAEHGIFTASVLKGLQIENANEAGQISGDRLFDFIARDLMQSGQEPIRMGVGRSLTLVSYPKAHPIQHPINETCPYQGLRFFDESTQDFFFGRKQVVETLKQKLEQISFVPVIGTSGSGKSSVVRAGLIPWLKVERGWQILGPILPSIDPLTRLKQVFSPLFEQDPGELEQVYTWIDHAEDALEAIISRIPGSERFLLVIDQFEEVFTLCPKGKEQERDRFIQFLTHAAAIRPSRLAVVITMRADFVEACLKYESLTQLIQRQAVDMPPLTESVLTDIIVKPAELQGYGLEQGLLEVILDDVREEPECLPLLEFTLTELWQPATEQEHRLTLTQYRDLGRLTEALNQRANEIYEEIGRKFKEQGQVWLKRIFLSLVRMGEMKDTRQRQRKADLLAIAGDKPEEQRAITQILYQLIKERLLVTGGQDVVAEEQGHRGAEDQTCLSPHSSIPSFLLQAEAAWVDLSHEALMDGWRQFSKWRAEGRDLRRLIDRIQDIQREWMSHAEDEQDNYLMMGGLLAEVRDNWEALEPELNAITKEFYRHSYTYDQERIAELQRALQSLQELVQQVTIASTTALRGGEAVKSMVSGILRIRKIVGEVNIDAKQISESSPEILHISSLVAQIASRNNLLALNATIEAARSGTKNQAFAIIADEVRQLADRAARAAREIDQTVSRIQRMANSMISGMEEGTEQVLEGAKLAMQARKALEESIQISDRLNSLVKSVTADISSRLNRYR